MTHGKAVKELCAMLQKTFDAYGPVELFRGFVDACNLALEELPCHLHYAVTRESIVPEDSKARWEKTTGRFSPQTLEAFAHGFGVLLEACQFGPDPASTDSIGGPDVIGSVYMDLFSGRSNKWNYNAQYFTPWNISLMMAKMQAGNLVAEFHAKVKRIVQEDPLLQAMTFSTAIVSQAPDDHGDSFAWWLQKACPLIKPKIQPIKVIDPCVGSGIMLLAFAACHPLWLSQIGYIQYYGIDIDPLCVEMCKLNMRLYGLDALQITPATAAKLVEFAGQLGPMEKPYQEVIAAQPEEHPAEKAALVERINAARIEQLILFE